MEPSKHPKYVEICVSRGGLHLRGWYLQKLLSVQTYGCGRVREAKDPRQDFDLPRTAQVPSQKWRSLHGCLSYDQIVRGARHKTHRYLLCEPRGHDQALHRKISEELRVLFSIKLERQHFEGFVSAPSRLTTPDQEKRGALRLPGCHQERWHPNRKTLLVPPILDSQSPNDPNVWALAFQSWCLPVNGSKRILNFLPTGLLPLVFDRMCEEFKGFTSDARQIRNFGRQRGHWLKTYHWWVSQLEPLSSVLLGKENWIR